MPFAPTDEIYDTPPVFQSLAQTKKWLAWAMQNHFDEHSWQRMINAVLVRYGQPLTDPKEREFFTKNGWYRPLPAPKPLSQKDKAIVEALQEAREKQRRKNERFTSTDAAILLQDFLDIHDPGVDPLGEYQRQSAVYVKFRDQEPMDETSMRIFLFYAFMARTSSRHSAGALPESLRSDLVPAFENHTEVFLKTLQSLPFLMNPVCYYLNGHFGFENVPLAKKKDFLKKNRTLILEKLGKDLGKECLKQFHN
jgi:hypothetical protein